MDDTPNLLLPYILPSQAQKHVTHNEAIRRLDALVQLSFTQRTAQVPASPEEGERFLVEPGAGGEWSGHDFAIAAWQDGAWTFLSPRIGWQAWNAQGNVLMVWDGNSWLDLPSNTDHIADRLGINTDADNTNRLAVKSDAVLFSHDDATPGTGDMRQMLNKAQAEDVASIIYQTGYSGRAELGLSGSDDLTLKTSNNGSDWKEAMIADSGSGAVRFPSGIRHGASGSPMAGLVLVSGGDGEVSFVRFDRARNQDPRQATIASVAGDTITLTTSDSDLFFHTMMRNVSLVRIWNLSRSPLQSAWLCWNPAADQLKVMDAAQIVGWLPGDTIQLGDVAGEPGVPNGFTRGYAVDISPMMHNMLGSVFPQRGILFKCSQFGVGARVAIALSPTTGGGSFLGGNSLSDGQPNVTMHMSTTTEPSPVSNSNLVFVRESGAPGTVSISALSALALLD
ncbi:MAG: DUF2793 domain-containing protein [Rhizobiaceae bacterium]